MRGPAQSMQYGYVRNERKMVVKLFTYFIDQLLNLITNRERYRNLVCLADLT